MAKKKRRSLTVADVICRCTGCCRSEAESKAAKLGSMSKDVVRLYEEGKGQKIREILSRIGSRGDDVQSETPKDDRPKEKQKQNFD